MSDEIKEISNRICQNCKYHYIEEISFDYPQSCCNKTNPNHTTEKWLNCDNFEYSQDYITNLQQELERYKHYSKTTGIEELMQENEYLKKHQRFHKKFGNDYIFCVEGDKETYKDLLLEKQEELEDYKSRVEKAIEAINTQLKNAEGGYKDNLRIIKFNLIKGSCTFEDLKTEDDYKYDGGKDEKIYINLL